MLNIKSTGSVEDKKLYALLYGPSGNGKTWQAKTLNSAGYKTILLNIENGALCLSDSNIDYIDCTKDDAGNPIPRERRLERCKEVLRELSKEEYKRKYNTIFFDSITEYCQFTLERMKLDMPEKGDGFKAYGGLLVEMLKLIIGLRDLAHYNVVVTCLSKPDRDETGRRFISFDLSGQIADRIPQFFDFVFYLKVNPDSSRSFVCGPTDSIVAKDRSGRLNQIEPADLGAVFNKVLSKGVK
jgi:hypothetical protein